jgi:uncharacterized protein (TIGR00645 family)
VSETREAGSAKLTIERAFESGLFFARWLMAPFYVGLLVALGALLVVFVRELVHDLMGLADLKPERAILMALTLIDLSLLGNLLLVVTYAGYENFVSRIHVRHAEDRPNWMGTIDFAGLKMKLIASIVAISAIALLKAYLEMEETGVDAPRLGWMIGVLLTFVVSGVLLALMDLINSRTESHGAPSGAGSSSDH